MSLVIADEFKSYTEPEFYNYHINFISNRYSIIKGEEATLATFGVGFCSQEDMNDCVLFVNLLDNAILPIPTCKPDGSIIWPECKTLHFTRFCVHVYGDVDNMNGTMEQRFLCLFIW